MRDVPLDRLRAQLSAADATFIACLATILELSPVELGELEGLADGVPNDRLTRWLAGRGLGLVPIAQPRSFAWPGPWLGLLGERRIEGARTVVMYGVPPGIAFDPLNAGGRSLDHETSAPLTEGFVVSATDIALARPPRPSAPTATRTVVSIHVAPSAGAAVRNLERAAARAGVGLEGDRHSSGLGTFPSGLPGSALTLIDAEVCRSLGLTAQEHRRNIVTEGIDLNSLVGHDFLIAGVRCRGMRLCEPCRVMERYAARAVLRPLVHRGGLRADILEDGTIAVGDTIAADTADTADTAEGRPSA